ncbi:unnamed protein product (mitochondrion) [Plasmodiophora brassicae]|uniref:Uncharacterized protein n=1 Tax=Plasmodiophora brassicae TaxID=37360 RepID=A0A0G4IWD6_PLABS|nr:hypothetical protein PBRA_007310 [Plasmodiophora brassicae]SPQ95925.1 unnamed protein product [Plasmodiophora brassicae]
MGISLDFIRSQVSASTPVVVVTSNHIVDAVWFESAVDMVMIDLHRISRELAAHPGITYLDRWVARLSHEAYFTEGQRGVHCTDKKPPEPFCWEQAAIFAALA